MAQIQFKLNNQMSLFHTSQILILDQSKSLLEPTMQIEIVKQSVLSYLDEKKLDIARENITFFNEAFLNFPIEEIRLMQSAAGYSSSFSGKGQRAFILMNFETAGVPAQNAALKILEESPANTLILLPVYELWKILETIASRCLVIQLPQTKNNFHNQFTWPTNYSQAIELASKYKDRNEALSLVGGLLQLENQAKKIFLETYQALRHNQNIQLTLENCFFSLVGLKL